jgi:hypothetical protein
MKRLLLLLLCAATLSYAGALTHRYSFEVDATDSITFDQADGVLSNGVTIVGEQAVFPGGTGSANPATPIINLPGKVWRNMDETTIEMWITVDASVNNNYTPIAWLNGSDGVWVCMSPIQVQRPLYGGYTDINPGSRICPAGVETHFVVTMKDTAYNIYTNGTLMFEGVMNGPFSVPDADAQECLIGKGNWDHEAAIVCTLNELRFYDVAISPAAIADNFNNGPDADPVPEPTLFGAALLGLALMLRRKA